MCIQPDRPFKWYLTIRQQKYNWHLHVMFHPKGRNVELFLKEIYKYNVEVTVRTYDSNVFHGCNKCVNGKHVLMF